jgi:hypothetical protein
MRFLRAAEWIPTLSNNIFTLQKHFTKMKLFSTLKKRRGNEKSLHGR